MKKKSRRSLAGSCSPVFGGRSLDSLAPTRAPDGNAVTDFDVAGFARACRLSSILFLCLSRFGDSGLLI